MRLSSVSSKGPRSEATLGMAVLLCVAPLLAQTKAFQGQRLAIYTSAQAAEEADRLFREVNVDAQQIDAHATELGKWRRLHTLGVSSSIGNGPTSRQRR